MKPESLTKLHEYVTNEAFLCVIVFETSSHRCVFMNNICRETLEYDDAKDVCDLKIEQLEPTTPRDGYIPFSKDFVENQGFHQGVLMEKSNQSIFIADVGIKGTELDGTDYSVVMFRDVTLQAKLQRDILHKQQELQLAFGEMQEQNEALKALDQAKDRFIALTTHELKTPLSAMIATAEVLKLGFYDNEEQMKEFILTIYTEGNHLLTIVQDILDFGKIQAGKMDFYIEKATPVKIIEDHFKTFENMAAEKNVTLDLVSTTLDTDCYYDELRLKQVTANILNNAIKFTAKDTTVRVDFESTDKDVIVWVHDQGPGIPEEHRDRIFNEFETVGNVNTHHKGTGLGMPISKRLMEQMGGEIGFKCEDGKGTSFFFRIPKEKVLSEDNYRGRPEFAQEVA